MDILSFFAEHFDLPILDWIAGNLQCAFLDFIMPLITLYEMWDEENPCLIMMKNLPAGGNEYDR